MRTLSLLLFIFILFSSCKHEVRYSEAGPEIETAKAAIAAYEAGDWAAMKKNYADTVKFYHNTLEGVSFEEATGTLNGLLSAVSEYGFDDDIEFEFVTADNGVQWVSWWGVWRGKLKANGKELTTPVHVSAKIVDGKIAVEYGYWDNQPMAAAMAEIAAQAEAAEEESEQ